MLRLKYLRTSFIRNILLKEYASDATKPAPKPESTSAFAVDASSTNPPSSSTTPPPPSPATPSTQQAAKSRVDLLMHSNVFVKLGQVESLPDAIPKTAASFDDVPGPALLKRISKFWTFVPVVGTQVTASTMQYLLSAGKLFGSQLSWGNNLWLFRWLLDEYGPVVRLHGPFGGDIVIVSRPEHANVVFQNEGPYPIRSTLDCVEKYRLQYRKYKQAGPFIMFGPEWEKLRKSIEQPLQTSLLYQYDKIGKTCQELVDRIVSIRNRQQEMPKDFEKEIQKWSLECLCSVMFNKHIGFLDPRGLSSTSEPAIILESLNGATQAIKKCEYGLHLWKFFETPSWKALVMHCDTIDNILTKYIRKAQDRLRDRKNKGIHVKPEEMSLMERFLLKDSVVPEDMQTILLDMMLIGVNTASHAIAFMLYHLARFPRAQQKLYDEIKNLSPDVEKDILVGLPFLKACIKESLRLQPPMPILSRILTKDIFVHGYRVPKGTYMLIATKLSSLREEHFEDATKFKPDRWLTSDVGKEMDSLASIPFGYGAKACLAKDLAEVEISALIFKILRKFRIEYHYGDIGSTNRLIASPTRALKFRLVDRT